MSELSFGGDCIFVSTRDADYRIPIQNILYIESNSRKITIHTPSKDYDCYEKLSTLEQNFDHITFIRCHQSYLVAVSKITSYDNQNLTLQGTHTRVPVSRQYRKKIRDFLQNQSCNGTLVGISGAYSDYVIQVQNEQRIIIGRDAGSADIIIQLPMVSRMHCEITYHQKERAYTIVDYSTNGTFIQGNIRLVPKQEYVLKPGTELCFGDSTTAFKVL